MKILKNQKGFGLLGWIFLMVVLVMVIGIFSVQEDRVAIAEGVESGALVETAEANRIVHEVDRVLDGLHEKRGESFSSGKSYNGFIWMEKSWMTLFWAKVQLERARLKMEIEASRRKWVTVNIVNAEKAGGK